MIEPAAPDIQGLPGKNKIPKSLSGLEEAGKQLQRGYPPTDPTVPHFAHLLG